MRESTASDPLAIFVAQTEHHSIQHGPTAAAEWLRANRDEIIRLLYADDRDAALLALGGRHSGRVWTNTAIGASTNRGWRRTDDWQFVEQEPTTAPPGWEFPLKEEPILAPSGWSEPASAWSKEVETLPLDRKET